MSVNYNLDKAYFRYIDDTDEAWTVKLSIGLGEAGQLPRIEGASYATALIGRNCRLRHMKMVALEGRPGMQKYRADVITNERDWSKVLNKTFIVNGVEMRCIKFVGEQRRG